jgi:hypothetical protein
MATTTRSPRISLQSLLGATFTAALFAAGCSGAADPHADLGEDPISNQSGFSTPDGKSWAAPFLDTSTMRGSGDDWDYCHGKATCAPGETISGISVVPGGPGKTALCTKGSGFSGDVTATLTLDASSDARRAKRAVNGDPDWDAFNYKLECGSGEYVSAVSEAASQCASNNRFHAVQCSKGEGLSDDGCTARVMANGDARGSMTSGDWDAGAFKGECGASEYVAGISVSPESGSPHAILCCPASGSGDAPVGKGDPFFGLSIDHGSWGSEQASTMRDLGAGLVRIQFCDWPASKGALEGAVNTALAAGLEVHAELNYCTLPQYPDSASWHKGYADSGNEFSGAFAAAAKDIAATFQGKIFVYEIWNEPNAAPRPVNWPDAFWPSANNANWDGACTDYPYGADYDQGAWAVCPKQLGVLTTNAFMAIKETDPGARVVAGNVLFHGDDGWVAKEYWKQVEKSPAVAWHKENKGGVPWDYVGIHPYAYRPTDGSLEAQINSFKGILGSFGDPAQVALTEYGWYTDGNGDPYFKADEGTQAAYLKETFALARNMNLGFVTWFNYLDGGGLTFGMRRADGSWKLAGRAFCEAASAPSCPAP